jgi:hypothetical protein
VKKELLQRIAALEKTIVEAKASQEKLAAAARLAGVTFAELGGAVGITAQGAWHRWRNAPRLSVETLKVLLKELEGS